MKLTRALNVLDKMNEELEDHYCDLYEEDKITEEYLSGVLDGLDACYQVLYALLQEYSEVIF